MAWDGWYEFAGTEIINVARTEAYIRWANVGWFRGCMDPCDLPLLLDETYTSPRQDDAPWVDPNDRHTYDFLGVYPLEVAGIKDSTAQAAVIESTVDGGVVGRTRYGTKTVVFNAALLARDECAAEAGFRWLKVALTGNPCQETSEAACTGSDLCYLSCCPCVDDMGSVTLGSPATLVASNLATNPKPVSATGYTGTFMDPPTINAGVLRGTVSNAAGALPRAQIVSTNGSIPITESVTYYMGVEARGTTARQFQLRLWWMNDAGANVAPVTNSALVTIDPVTWAPATVSAVAPVGATRLGWQFCSNGTSAVGTYIEMRQLRISTTALLPTYFDGDTPDDGTYEYYWSGADDGSISRKVTVGSPPVVTEFDPSDCFDEHRRSLRHVSVTNGPIITSKRQAVDGSAIWTCTWTAVAGNPFEYGAEKPVIRGFMDPTVDMPWVEGEVPAGGSFDPDGFVQSEVICPTPTFQPIVDPLCSFVTSPPTVPNIALDCFDFPVNYTRRQFVLPKSYVPLWGTVVPYFEIHARDTAVRNLRIRFYADYDGTGDPNTDPCAFCGDIIFSYIPLGATLVFDGSDSRTYAITPGGIRQGTDHLVFGSDGQPFDWPMLSCGVDYIVTIDLPQTQAPPIVDMALYARSV